jgi:hypothetical protein
VNKSFLRGETRTKTAREEVVRRLPKRTLKRLSYSWMIFGWKVSGGVCRVSGDCSIMEPEPAKIETPSGYINLGLPLVSWQLGMESAG